MPHDALPTPLAPAHRTVRGAFRTTAELDRALARLAAARPPALVDLVAADARAERWLAGSAGGAARALLATFAGAARDVALGYRQAWQSIELAGGVPAAGGSLGGAADGGVAGGAARRVRVELPEGDLTSLLDWSDEVGDGAGAWVRPGTGSGWVVVPDAQRADAALAWLGAQARGRGGRLTIAAAAAVGT